MNTNTALVETAVHAAFATTGIDLTDKNETQACNWAVASMAMDTLAMSVAQVKLEQLMGHNAAFSLLVAVSVNLPALALTEA